MDKLIKATAAEGMIRIFACDSKDLVNEAVRLHGLKPTGAALLGRVLTAGVMMSSMLKNKKDLLTIQMNGKGPAGGVLVTGSGDLRIKGYLGNPDVEIGRKANGKIDVSGALGTDGNLTVIMDMGLKEPYVSSIPIQTGEIAEDFAYYYTVSEQLPSAVSLGVLVGGDGRVIQSSGFLIQMMPGHSDALADSLSEKIEKLPPITTLLNEYNDLTEILKNIFLDFDLKINETLSTDYHCDCSREKVEKALMSIGFSDLTELYEDNKTETLTCHFCNKKYDFSHEDIGRLIEEAKQ